MRNKTRTYVAEVLDIFKFVSRRHGSVREATTVNGLSYFSLRVYLPLQLSGSTTSLEVRTRDRPEDMAVPAFSCRYRTVDLHTHAPASDLLYHLGPDATTGSRELIILKEYAAARWRALTMPKVQKLFIRIPARATAIAHNDSS
ncbi:hypothetical protein C8Q77DRAFT_1148254 [Trametes polyzona]|nr:hypothetical protein C8Q77DRAFT_1148254 [Trametes polyzona]